MVRTIIANAIAKGQSYIVPKFIVYSNSYLDTFTTPTFSDTIKFLAENQYTFSRDSINLPTNGIFHVPETFSLVDNYEASFLFLKQLFTSLFSQSSRKILIDYKDCKRIDVDASACMDVMLREFIFYYKACKRKKIKCKVDEITPINVNNQDVQKVIFSVGAYKNITGLDFSFPDVISFPLITGDNQALTRGADQEITVTKMVDYIIECLARMNRTLTIEAEDQLSKVIGEVLINAGEHSGMRYRYAIGYFQESKSEVSHAGVFQLSIFSFGKTIYQNFKQDGSQDWAIVKRMKQLSNKYTSEKWFQSKKFEEETLWTLYALQEGVTSIQNKQRGNGSIHFLESFFKLKGDMNEDDLSSLTLISGNTRIVFDGHYKIEEKNRGATKIPFKVVTFNESGNIEDKPDEKYVTFVENFFPGTLISATISINFNSLEN